MRTAGDIISFLIILISLHDVLANIPDFQVNENAGANGAFQYYPSISTDGNGNFVMTWVDSRNGYNDIYAQRYSNDGSALGDNFKVNDGQNGRGWPHRPSISSDDNGNFVITWMDGSNEDNDSDIYAQLYSSDGSALGDNFKINKNHWGFHATTMDCNGNFVMTWGGYNDIYAQRYSNDGSALGDNFKVNDGQHGRGWPERPSISSDDSGNFVIAWEDERNGNNDIYAQHYSSDGSVLGDNFKVNDDQASADQRYPSICTDNSGNFVITWADRRKGKVNSGGDYIYDLYGQYYSSDGSALGDNFKVNIDFEIIKYWGIGINSISISADGSGNFMGTWARANGPGWNFDIHAQRFSNDGAALGDNFKVNDDHGSSDESDPCISTDNSGNFLIMWADGRNGNNDIYAQRYSNDGSALGDNFKINENHGSITMDPNGNFVITWCSDDGTIYAQRYSSDGSILGDNFKFNNDQESVDSGPPSICTDSSGNFVIARADKRNGNDDIYAQRYSSDGSTVGGNFRVNDDLGNTSQRNPSITVDGSGKFLISWLDKRNAPYDYYAQLYSSDGSKVGHNIRVNDMPSSATYGTPSISTDGSGNFVITWRDDRNGNDDIYAQRYSSDGSAMGANFKVNDDEESAELYEPSISTDGSGNFVITWRDDCNGDSDIYAQRYAGDGTAVGENFRITNTSHYNQSSPDVKLCNGLIYTTWVDNRAGSTGYDIWANVLDWENPYTLISDKEQSQTPTAFILMQNYPNPFNPTTAIQYQLPKGGMVTLEVYNFIGQRVKRLVNHNQTAGIHQQGWDGRNDDGEMMPTGVYFYRLRSGDFSATRKMLLMQ
jgi:hypothetical protein